MGGLVARYFLECLEGWRDTRRLVTFGTPYRGSLNALNFLVHGMQKRLGPVPVLDLSRLLRSFPSIYQLLPIYPCLDPGDGKLIRVSEAVGLPHVDPDRARAADAFHREIERAVSAHLDDEAYRRGRYTIHPIVGTFQATLLSARRSGDDVEVLRTLPGFAPDGDGTVPRVSATPIEFAHEEAAMFAAERHSSLQHNDAVLVQLAGLLGGQDTSRVRAGASAGLELDDAFGPGEPVAFRFRAADPMAPLTAVVTAAGTGAEVARLELGAAGEWQGGELAPPAPGTYRVTLAGEGVEPVTDTFVVVGEQDLTAAGLAGNGGVRVRGGQPGPGPVIAGPTPTEPPALPVPERRLLQGRFPERVRLGEEVSLLVRLGLQPGGRLEAGLRPLAVPEAGLDVVLLLVESPGFTLRSPERAVVHVVPRQDSDWAGFELQAAREGVHTLQVEAFADGSGLGGLAVQVSVDPLAIYLADLAAIPRLKAPAAAPVKYISTDAVTALLAVPDPSTRIGLRDQFFMILMYDLAARDAEMLALNVADIDTMRLTVDLLGKGSKPRRLPITSETAQHFGRYAAVFHPSPELAAPMFYTMRNHHPTRMSDDNVARFIRQHAATAKARCPDVPARVHPHMLRHSRAMHLYLAGMPLALLTDWLGHADPETTLIYAHADTEMKRHALEKANSATAQGPFRPRCGTTARTSSSAYADSRSDTGLFRQARVTRARQPRSRASYAQEGTGVGITRESE